MLSIKPVFNSIDFVSLLKLQASWRSFSHYSSYELFSGITVISCLGSWFTHPQRTALLPIYFVIMHFEMPTGTKEALELRWIKLTVQFLTEILLLMLILGNGKHGKQWKT